MKLVAPWFDAKGAYTWLELDGNSQIVLPSRQPEYTVRSELYPHHGGPDGTRRPFLRANRSKLVVKLASEPSMVP